MKEFIEFNGYKIYSNGTFISPKGRTIKKITINYPDSHVILIISGKKIKYNTARLMYSLFKKNGEKVDNSELIVFKDNDSKNVAISNLKLVKKKNYFKKYKTKKYTNDFVMEIKKAYKKNTKNTSNQYNRSGPSVRELARIYGCSLSTVCKIIKNEY